MSVELYRVTEGVCKCLTPLPVDEPFTCRHWYECEFGVLEHSDPRPDRRQIGPLMLTTPYYLESLIRSGPVWWPLKGGRVDSACVRDGREFVHCDWQGQRWTWEVFGAHFRDKPGFELLIGRWPD